MRRLILAVLLLVPASLATAAAPNILFFAVDDLRPELGCYGNAVVKSPNLDRFATTATLFRRAYCQQAVCSPSRTSLLTGTRPDTTRVYDLQTHFRLNMPDVVTLPQQFKNHGYHTEGMGKIFHGGLDDPDSWSIDSWPVGGGHSVKPAAPKKGKKKSAFAEPGDELFVGAADSGACVDQKQIEQMQKKAEEKKAARHPGDRGAPYAAPDVADNELFDGQLADHAIERLGAMKAQDKPFFLAVGFIKPHLPFIAPKKYWDMYDGDKIPAATNPFPPKDAPKEALSGFGELRAYDGMPAKGPVSAEQARQLKHGYYAAVSYTDAQVGRVLAELDRLGLADNTIVVLWGDHGWKLGEHGEWCKHTNFENDANAPLFVRAPGMKAGQVTDALVEFVDIYPSLCELAGLDRPSHLEGVSFVPVLKNPGVAWKPAAFSQYPRGSLMGYSMRTDRYRLTRWVDKKDHDKVDAVELYDHQTDPAENVNLAVDPAQAALVKQLTEQSIAGWKAAKPK